MSERLREIKKLINLLDRYNDNYKTLSKRRANTYLGYIELGIVDEEKFVKPTLFPDFLTRILHFNKSDLIPEAADRTGKRPDFTPEDTNLHPFVFEIKGTESTIKDLKSEFKKKSSGYIKADIYVKYAIITNMKYLLVFTEEGLQRALSFSLVKIYRDWKIYGGKSEILDEDNTKQYCRFIEEFSKKELTRDFMIEAVANAKPWGERGLIDLKEDWVTFERLTRDIRYIVNHLRTDINTNHRREILETLKPEKNRQAGIAKEIYRIAKDLDTKFVPPDPGNVTHLDLEALLQEKEGLLYKALQVYFHRVAYFTMTRLLLIRAWEDAELIPRNEWILFNGGFKDYYYGPRCNKNIRTVLSEAYRLGRVCYEWLYTNQNNYSWHIPSDDYTIDVLYRLSKYNFSALNRDVLGAVYEDYLEIAAKKKIGQYYTPYQIVDLIWDRVGFTDENAFFHFEGGRRRPKLVFDPATGSGGFLVEGATRLIKSVDLKKASLQDLKEIKDCIIEGFHGSELSVFSYYLTEVNMLILLIPLIKEIIRRNAAERKAIGKFMLGVIPQNSLALHNVKEKAFREVDAAYESDRLKLDEEHGIAPLEGEKQTAFDFIRDTKTFDYAVANPPYIGEKGNKELFRKTLWIYRYWQKYYQGKMDYLYWFVILALSKLREGGKLGFITTAYWPTADGARKLREYILNNAKIVEIIDFGEMKLFEHAKGQHNMVFVLEQCSNSQNDVTDPNREERAENRIKIVKVKEGLEGRTISDKLTHLTEHIKKYIDRDKYSDSYLDVFWSPVKQGELTEDAWNLMYSKAVKKVLKKIAEEGKFLKELCSINQGFVSGGHKVTKGNLKSLPEEAIREYNIREGDGIFVLSQKELSDLNLSEEERRIIKPVVKNSEIHQYVVVTEDKEFLIHTTKETVIDKFPRIEAHLEKFKPILLKRLERYKEDYEWFKLHRERERQIFEGEKILVPYRSEFNCFGYDTDCLYGSTDMYFINRKKDARESLKYILALLNSRVLDCWCFYQLKPKGKVREYFPTPLSKIPIHQIDFDNPEEIKVHYSLVELVNSIIADKIKLAKYNRFFRGARLTRLRDEEPTPEISRSKIAESMPDEDKRLIRTYRPKLLIEVTNKGKGGEFFLRKAEEARPDLLRKEAVARLTGKNGAVVEISGDPRIVPYLVETLKADWIGKRLGQVQVKLLLPRNVRVLNDKIREISTSVKKLRHSVKMSQEKIDKIVYRLYKLTKKQIETVEKTMSTT